MGRRFDDLSRSRLALNQVLHTVSPTGLIAAPVPAALAAKQNRSGLITLGKTGAYAPCLVAQTD